MIHVLFDCPNLDDFYEDLKDIFLPEQKVAVVAFSFYDDYVTDATSWERVYGKGVGRCYFETVEPLGAFGIPEENITFINYFTDTKESAAQKVKEADVIYFTGGLPDRMMDRIREFDLCAPLLAHKGVVVGYSAGAVIQLDEYHLSPDNDYPAFGYYRGLSYLNGFSLEVHYENKPCQDESVRRVLAEKKQPVYILHTAKGGVIVENGTIRTVGKVDVITN